MVVYYFSVLWEIKPLELDFTPHKSLKINPEDIQVLDNELTSYFSPS